MTARYNWRGSAAGTPDLHVAYGGRRVLVTGGLGFICQQPAHRLVALGARVTLMDPMIEQQGGNFFNIGGIEDRVTVEVADVRDRDAMDRLIRGQHVLFNCAGQVSHIDSTALQQRAVWRELPRRAEQAAAQVLSLPIYPEMEPSHQDEVIAAVNAWQRR